MVNLLQINLFFPIPIVGFGIAKLRSAPESISRKMLFQGQKGLLLTSITENEGINRACAGQGIN